MGLIRVTLLNSLIITLLIASGALASFSGPTEIITEGWGTNADQFGIDAQDMRYTFPTKFGVTSDGRIMIADPVNSRVKIYNSNGSLTQVVLSQGLPQDVKEKFTRWPTKSFYVSDNYFLTTAGKYTQLYDFHGSLFGNYTYPTVKGSVVFIFTDGSFITQGSGNNYYKYSPAGQLLQAYSSMPLELGVVKSKGDKLGRFIQSIQFESRLYTFVIPWELLKSFKQDAAGNLIAVAQTDSKDMVYKIHYCGRVLGQMQIPGDVGHYTGLLGQEPVGKFDIEYGEPVTAPNGDVYTWKRTPINYSILKWTWVNDPNAPSGPDAPSGLTVTPSTTGLYLTWTASPSDPGCLTNYEISRATSAGGSGNTITTVTAGKVNYNDSTAEGGTTYYYKVRAVAGREYSPFTSEVSGKR